MEDFSTIIWIAVAIIFSALSSIKRKNQRSTAENAPEKSDLPESWPLFEVLQQATESPPQKKSDSEQITSSLEDTSAPEAVSLETIEPEIPQGYTTSATEPSPIANNRQKARKERQIKPQTDATGSNPSNEDASEITDFDLKKAVIYSEILKPKFEEE